MIKKNPTNPTNPTNKARNNTKRISGAGGSLGSSNYKTRTTISKRQTNFNKNKLQTSQNAIVGKNSVLEALMAKTPAKYLILSKNVNRDKKFQKIITLAKEQKLSLAWHEKSDIDRVFMQNHQGAVLVTPEFSYYSFEKLASSTGILVLLDGITDQNNFGAIIRSCGGFGVNGVIIPSKNSVSVTPTVWKTSSGVLNKVKVSRVINFTKAVDLLKKNNFLIIGLDAGKNATNLANIEFNNSKKIAVIVGSEAKGISNSVLKKCDFIAKIPIDVESLNASVATGIALYQISQSKQ